MNERPTESFSYALALEFSPEIASNNLLWTKRPELKYFLYMTVTMT